MNAFRNSWRTFCSHPWNISWRNSWSRNSLRNSFRNYCKNSSTNSHKNFSRTPVGIHAEIFGEIPGGNPGGVSEKISGGGLNHSLNEFMKHTFKEYQEDFFKKSLSPISGGILEEMPEENFEIFFMIPSQVTFYSQNRLEELFRTTIKP